MSGKISILIIEDEKNIRSFISTALTAGGYKVISCTGGKEAISLIASHCPDVVLLDLGLPDMDGLQVLKEIRKWSSVPIIVVSARTQESEKVEALDSGADDYITKPFGTSELLARIRTALRHNHKKEDGENSSGKIYHCDDFTIDFEKRMVMAGERKIHLTQIEFKLVSLLAQNSGKVLTYDYMITNIWGPYALKDNQILRVNMANIRRKLENNPADPKYIFTEVGIGYRMAEC